MTFEELRTMCIKYERNITALSNLQYDEGSYTEAGWADDSVGMKTVRKRIADIIAEQDAIDGTVNDLIEKTNKK